MAKNEDFDLFGGEAKPTRRRRTSAPAAPGQAGPSGPAMSGGPSGPAMSGGPSGPAMAGGKPAAGARRRRAVSNEDFGNLF